MRIVIVCLLAALGMIGVLFTLTQARAAGWKHEDCYSEKICKEFFNGEPGSTHTIPGQYSNNSVRHTVDCETGDKAIEFDWFEKALKPDECLGQASRYAIITGKQATCVLMSRSTPNLDRVDLYAQAAKRANVIYYVMPVDINSILPNSKYRRCR